MNDTIRYPFEKIANILYKQARKVHRLWPNKYEVDELVNEVWARGNIQKLDNIKYVSAKAYFDMIDYIRKNEGRFAKRPQTLTNRHIIEKVLCAQNETSDYFHLIEDEEKKHIAVIEDKEEVEHCFSYLSERDSNILRQYFLEEKTLEEIGEEYNLDRSSISTIKKKSLKKIKRDRELDEKLPRVNILPEYVVDLEIDNNNAVERGEYNG